MDNAVIHAYCPYVRYARKSERTVLQGLHCAIDHRIFYCHNGFGEYEICGKKYPFSPGTVLYIPAGSPYRLLFEKEMPTFSGCNFDFYQAHTQLSAPIPPSPYSLFQRQRILEKQILEQDPLFSSPLHLENAFDMEYRFLEIANEYERHNLYYDLYCSTLLKSLIIRLISISESQVRGVNNQKANAILQYIHSHYDQKLTNRTIAEHFNYHEYYISSLIQKYTGLPLHQYVLNYKMHVAIGLLQSTNMTIGEVAERVCIPDIKHFSKCFTKIIGTPPSHFKVRAADCPPKETTRSADGL